MREASVAIVPSVAFFGALGDLLATVALGYWPSVDEISIAVALDSWKPTRGTRLAGKRRAGRRVVFRNRRIEILPGKQACPRPGPGTFLRRLGSRKWWANCRPWTWSRSRVISARKRSMRISMSLRSRTSVIQTRRGLRRRTTEAARRKSSSSMSSCERGSERRRATARGRDIYAITAPIVAEATEPILDGRCKRAGVGSISEIFEAEDFLRALAPELSFEVTETTGASGEPFHHA